MGHGPCCKVPSLKQSEKLRWLDVSLKALPCPASGIEAHSPHPHQGKHALISSRNDPLSRWETACPDVPECIRCSGRGLCSMPQLRGQAAHYSTLSVGICASSRGIADVARVIPVCQHSHMSSHSS